jgi:thioredoxin reductase (NADPH)
MIVYNELAKQLGADVDERGFVKADESGLTSVTGLYVAGDLKANTKKQIYTAWDTAVSAANAVNMKIRAARRPE